MFSFTEKRQAMSSAGSVFETALSHCMFLAEITFLLSMLDFPAVNNESPCFLPHVFSGCIMELRMVGLLRASSDMHTNNRQCGSVRCSWCIVASASDHFIVMLTFIGKCLERDAGLSIFLVR